jgi:hypothetical protein
MNTILLTYLPNFGITITDIKLNWGMSRQKVRELVNSAYTEADETVNLNEEGESDSNQILTQKRDIYANLFLEDNLLFLNYDNDNLLKEVEIHHGIDILIDKIKITFRDTLDDAEISLKTISDDIVRTEEGELLIANLKMSLADSEFMGGEGNILSYFYCAENVEHWEDV